MKRAILILGIYVFLTACTSQTVSENLIQTAIVETQRSQPSPTQTIIPPTLAPTPTPTLQPSPTPIDLRTIEIESIIIKPGDLPAGYSGAQIRNQAPDMFTGVVSPIRQLYQQFQKSDDIAGGVTFLFYDDPRLALKAYDQVADGFGDDSQVVQDVGEKALFVGLDFEILGSRIQSADLVFLRCNVVVHIRFGEAGEKDNIVPYAIRLDSRLRELVCSE